MKKNYPNIEKPDCVLLSTQDWPDLYISNTGVLIAQEGEEEHQYRAGDFTNYIGSILNGHIATDSSHGGFDEQCWDCHSYFYEPMKQCFFLAYRKGIIQFKDGKVEFSRLHFDHVKNRQDKNVYVDGHFLEYDGEYTLVDMSPNGTLKTKPRYKFHIKVTNPSKIFYGRVLEVCSGLTPMGKLQQIIQNQEIGRKKESYSQLDYEIVD